MSFVLRAGLLISFALISSACHVPKAIDAAISMEGKLDDMNGKMGKMNEAVRLQKMGIGHEQSMNEKIYLPTMALGGAKILTEAAHSDEIVQLVYGWIRSIESADSTNFTPGWADDRDGLVKEVGEQSRDIMKRKRSWYNGLLAISYMIPKAKIDEIIQREITQQGQFEETAYQILAMRAQFAAISSDSYKPINAAGVDRLAGELEKIRELTLKPFASKITIALSSSEEEITPFNLDQDGKKAAERAKEKLTKSMEAKTLTVGESAEWKAAMARFQAVVDSMLAAP